MLTSVAAIAALSAGSQGQTAKTCGLDKMRGGPGLVPRVLPFVGLQNGPGWRASQWACNVVAGVQTFNKVRRRGFTSRLKSVTFDSLNRRAQ